MPRTRESINIRAPARISVGLKDRNTCIVCGKPIPSGKFMCDECSPDFTKVGSIFRKK